MGKERVRQLMQRHGIRAKGKKKFVVTTGSKHQLPVAPDLVHRRFSPSAPNVVWSGDITYLPTDEGWLYLAAVLDLHSRQIVGWSLQPQMATSLVKDALLMACFRRRPAPGLIFHSDRGSQYCSHDFQDALKAWGAGCGGIATATNSRDLATVPCLPSRASCRQRCTTLALMPHDIATLATEAPGASHSAITSLFSSSLYCRRPTAMSLAIVST